MNKKTIGIIILIIVVVVVFAGVIIWQFTMPKEKTVTASFVCDDQKTIIATFYPNNDTRVDLQLSDGRKLSVPHAMSADGARYANADGSFVFWEKGNTAFIQENNQDTYQNCVIAGSAPLPQAQSVSDGIITMTYTPSFGLAVTPEQILTKTVIPACDPNFNYCFYYTADDYTGTNFESAGLRVQKRTDLNTQSTCLTTPPQGYDASFKPDKTQTFGNYSVSEFSNVGQGAAGHTSTGSLYRLFIPASSSCYEFETRVAQTEFGNYPAGSIKQFTSQDQQQVEVQLMNILEGTTIGNSNETLQLPQ